MVTKQTPRTARKKKAATGKRTRIEFEDSSDEEQQDVEEKSDEEEEEKEDEDPLYVYLIELIN